VAPFKPAARLPGLLPASAAPPAPPSPDADPEAEEEGALVTESAGRVLKCFVCKVFYLLLQAFNITFCIVDD
jgi:hypothetical protein